MIRQISLIFLLLLGLSIHAQTALPLIKTLQNLEEQFDVKFSYAVDEISEISIEQPPKFDNITAALDYLNLKTTLVFEAISKRYITISQQEKTINICGIITDASTGDKLLGATIEIKNAARGTLTDDSGRFELSNVSRDAELVISYLGFRQKFTNPSVFISPQGNCTTIALTPDNVELTAITVTQFLTTGLQKTEDDKTVLNTEDFGILPGLTSPDILQTIQVLPGVESVDESISNLNIRGGNNDENMILYDGIHMYNSGHFFGLISAYNPYMTKNISVVKNGTSSEYSNAASSTIIMNTETKTSDKLSGSAGVSMINADAFLQIPVVKNLNILVAARRSITDELSTPAYKSYFDRSFQDSQININETSDELSSDSRFYFEDYSAKVIYDLDDKHHFGASFIYIGNQLDYKQSQVTNGTESSRQSTLEQENLGASGSWTANWNTDFSTTVEGYYSRYLIDAGDRNVQTDQKSTQENDVLETGFKVKATQRFSTSTSLLAGYEFVETGIRNGTAVNLPVFTQRLKRVLRTHSVYGDLTFKEGKTFLRSGLRASYFDKFSKIRIEPRFNARQGFGNGFAIKAQGELKYQTATQIIDFEDDFLGVENRRWILADEQNYPLVMSQQVSAGFEYNHDNWLVDIGGYYKEVDGITASNQGFQNQFQFFQTSGSYTSHGLETIINKTIDKFSGWLTYTLAKTDYTFEDLTPSQFPALTDIRHSFTLAASYEVIDDLKISVGGMYRSGRPFTLPIAGNETYRDGNTYFVNYDAPNAENLSDFYRIDVSGEYSFYFGESLKGQINAGVLNILDRENVLQQYYTVDPNDNSNAIEVKNVSLGLTPNISLRVFF